MFSKERIITTLNHQEPDKVPYDLGGTCITGIISGAYSRLLSYLDIDEGLTEVHSVRAQRVKLSGEILKKFEVDTRGIFATTPTETREVDIRKERDGSKVFVDEFGTTWKLSKGGYNYNPIDYPLEGDLDKKAIVNHSWPEAKDPSRLDNLKEQAKRYRQLGKCVVLGNTLTGGIFGIAPRLRGYENFWKDLIQNPGLACATMDKLTELEMEFFGLVLKELGSYIDIVVELDDLGSQRGPLISPALYRKYVKPRHKKLFSFIKKEAENRVYILFHSDGSIYELIPDLIESGVDILNPVQYTAVNMDAAKLKKEFGDELTFWGGGIDTQNVLPKGSLSEVKDEVKRQIDILAPGGGFVFSTVHNIQPDVPPENIIAMWEALQEYGGY